MPIHQLNPPSPALTALLQQLNGSYTGQQPNLAADALRGVGGSYFPNGGNNLRGDASLLPPDFLALFRQAVQSRIPRTPGNAMTARQAFNGMPHAFGPSTGSAGATFQRMSPGPVPARPAGGTGPRNFADFLRNALASNPEMSAQWLRQNAKPL